jgi:Zn-dependent M28 family amino/carboxypeptidase
MRHRFTWPLALPILLAVACGEAPSPTAGSDDLSGLGPDLSRGTELACARRANNTIDKLLECVSVDAVRSHQAALQSIADANGGTRVAGARGYDASADYVEAQLEAAGYVVSRQAFQFQTFISLTPASLTRMAPPPTGPIATDIFSYSGSGDVTAAVTSPGLVGCDAADFAGFPAGDIALISRGGGCTFALKATNAFNAGAVAVVIYNNVPGNINGTLGNTFSLDLPVVAVTQAVGQELAATPGLVMRVRTETFRGLITTENLFAETTGGDPDHVVMAGAHLDGVNAGPGINDNASGVGALLETARALARLQLPNTVRFAFWGAEESGLVGSTYYVSSLASADRDRIARYLNFDMIGSPNSVFFVYDGDNSDNVGAGPGPEGSAAIEALFQSYYDRLGLPTKGTDLSGRSDYGPFVGVGIAVGGILSGAEGIKSAEEAVLWGGVAGQPYDPCYHLACDTYDNVNLETLRVNLGAVTWATFLSATDGALNTRVRGGRPAGAGAPAHTHALLDR